MTENEKPVAGMRKLAEENDALKKQVERQGNELCDALREVVIGFSERIAAIAGAHRKAVDGFNEVLAGHEIALNRLGAELKPVHMVEEAVAPSDTQPTLPENDGVAAPIPSIGQRLQTAQAAVIRPNRPPFDQQDDDDENHETHAYHCATVSSRY